MPHHMLSNRYNGAALALSEPYVYHCLRVSAGIPRAEIDGLGFAPMSTATSLGPAGLVVR